MGDISNLEASVSASATTVVDNPILEPIYKRIDEVREALSQPRSDSTTRHITGGINGEDYDRSLRPTTIINLNLTDAEDPLAVFLRMTGFLANKGQIAKSLLVKESKDPALADISIQAVRQNRGAKSTLVFEIKRTDTLKPKTPEEGFPWVTVEPIYAPESGGKQLFRGGVKVTLKDDSGKAFAFDPRASYDNLKGDALWAHIRYRNVISYTRPGIDGTSKDGIKLLNSLLNPTIGALKGQ